MIINFDLKFIAWFHDLSRACVPCAREARSVAVKRDNVAWFHGLCTLRAREGRETRQRMRAVKLKFRKVSKFVAWFYFAAFCVCAHMRWAGLNFSLINLHLLHGPRCTCASQAFNPVGAERARGS